MSRFASRVNLIGSIAHAETGTYASSANPSSIVNERQDSNELALASVDDVRDSERCYRTGADQLLR